MPGYDCTGGEVGRHQSLEYAVTSCNDNAGCGCIQDYGDIAPFASFSGTSSAHNGFHSCWVYVDNYNKK